MLSEAFGHQVLIYITINSGRECVFRDAAAWVQLLVAVLKRVGTRGTGASPTDLTHSKSITAEHRGVNGLVDPH